MGEDYTQTTKCIYHGPKTCFRGMFNFYHIPEEIITWRDFFMYTLKKEDFNTRTMVKISVLGVIAFVLMLLDFPLWFTPPFLKFDLSDVPALIGSFALGPMAGVIVQLVKNLLKILLAGTNTAAIGELANFIVGSVFVYVAGLIYYREKNFKNAIIGLIVGTIAMTVAISIANYYKIGRAHV